MDNNEFQTDNLFQETFLVTESMISNWCCEYYNIHFLTQHIHTQVALCTITTLFFCQWKFDVKEGGNDNGGNLFDYGIPSFTKIKAMIASREGYTPKSLSKRVTVAFTFIKDTM